MVKFQGGWPVDGVARKRPHMAMVQSAVPWGGGAMFEEQGIASERSFAQLAAA